MRDPRRRLARAVLGFPPQVRLAMLRILASNPALRVEAIRRLHQDPGSRTVAELLIDLEVDRQVKAEVMEALKESLPSR